MRGGKRSAPNGVCHSWEHGCALGVARDAVCLFSSESFSSSFFFFSVPPPFGSSFFFPYKSDFADERSSRHGAQRWIPRVEIYILGIAVCAETFIYIERECCRLKLHVPGYVSELWLSTFTIHDFRN